MMPVELRPEIKLATVCGSNDRKCRRQQQESELHKILNARGLLPVHAPAVTTPTLPNDGEALDLSSVFPRMYVRNHDHLTGSDQPGIDLPLSDLSGDVNRRIEKYVQAYKELSALTEIFRAYVSAVQITRKDASVCRNLRGRPLLDSEKVVRALPPVHPTELFVTVTSFEYSGERYRRLWSNRGLSLNGGVTIRARPYLEEALKVGVATEITRMVKLESAVVRTDNSWQAGGNHFVALLLDAGDGVIAAPTKISIDARSSLPSSPNASPNTAPRGPQRASIDAAIPSINPLTLERSKNSNTESQLRTIQGVGIALLFGCALIYLFVKGHLPWSAKVASAGANHPNRASRHRNEARANPDKSNPVASYAETEREFNLVFSDQDKVSRERMIKHRIQFHGGTRAEAMRQLVKDWRTDNIK